jgi:hypothetical protein
MCTKFIWLRIRAGEHGNVPSGLIDEEKVLNQFSDFSTAPLHRLNFNIIN